MNVEQLLFLKSFFKEPSITGSVIPSSKYLCRSMLDNINFHQCDCIVEYGAGTGVFTKEIIKLKKKDTIFISFEFNSKLYNEFLRELDCKDNNIYIINDTAENLPKYLDDIGVAEVDYFISGLPFAVLPKKVSATIFSNSYSKLKKGGEFTFFQYSLHSLRAMKEIFPKVKLKFQPINIPPAFIYQCRK